MNLWLRMLAVLIAARFRPRLALAAPSLLRFRVLPGDLDVYGHMNNGRYLTVMDLGRFDFILRSALGRAARAHGWNPLVAAVQMKYRRSLRLFEAYELSTRVLAWTAKWFFLEQTFSTRDGVAARALVKGLFFGAKGSIPTAEVLTAAGEMQPAPPLPPEVEAWERAGETRPGKGIPHV
jgi:acyl-CoA thioesterase FadM